MLQGHCQKVNAARSLSEDNVMYNPEIFKYVQILKLKVKKKCHEPFYVNNNAVHEHALALALVNWTNWVWH